MKAADKAMVDIKQMPFVTVEQVVRFRAAAPEIIESQRAEIEKGYQALELVGVPRERARSIGNGIAVYATRMAREVNFLDGEKRQLQARVKELEDQTLHCTGECLPDLICLKINQPGEKE